MKANNSTSLFQKDQVIESLKQSFVKLNPKTLIKIRLCSPWKYQLSSCFS